MRACNSSIEEEKEEQAHFSGQVFALGELIFHACVFSIYLFVASKLELELATSPSCFHPSTNPTSPIQLDPPQLPPPRTSRHLSFLYHIPLLFTHTFPSILHSYRPSRKLTFFDPNREPQHQNYPNFVIPQLESQLARRGESTPNSPCRPPPDLVQQQL